MRYYGISEGLGEGSQRSMSVGIIGGRSPVFLSSIPKVMLSLILENRYCYGRVVKGIVIYILSINIVLFFLFSFLLRG